MKLFRVSRPEHSCSVKVAGIGTPPRSALTGKNSASRVLEMFRDSAVSSGTGARGDSVPASRPSIREVAALAGVSISAVSLAINGKPGVSAAKRARVLRTVKELGYVRNGYRPAVGTRVLGVLMETLSIPAAPDRCYADIVAGIEEAAERLGYRLLLHLYRKGVDPIGDIRSLM